MEYMQDKIRIGVLGGGFAGLYCALRLCRKHSRAEVVLFDRNNYFLYTPFLHEVATGTVGSRHVAVPIRKIAVSGQSRDQV